jgi:predicted ribosomally synthesized peptide with SipW-like signal peptide
MLALIGVVSFGATRALFNDTEVSAQNLFEAGSIDLAIGSQFSSDFNGSGEYALDSDNNGRVLFSFNDLKPGDSGSVGFDLEVTSNDAYVCAMSSIDSYPENGLVDPESDAGDTTTGPMGGELQKYLQFATFDDEKVLYS